MSGSIIRKRFSQGAEIFHEGELGSCAYVIESGSVEISTRRGGSKVVLAQRGPNEIFGEMAIVDDKPRSATVTAVEDCELLVLSKAQLQQRIDNLDPVLKMVLGVILDRFRESLRSMHSETRSPTDVISAVDPQMQIKAYKAAINRIELEQSLRVAVEDHQLELFFQPLVGGRDGRLRGFEALSRWRHPERGLVSPAIFIEAAEESGLIFKLTEWALHSACAALKRIEKTPLFYDDFTISVNVSAHELSEPAFINIVTEAVQRTGVNPKNLTLEITESALMKNPDATLEVLEDLKSLGFSLSIDDFGTGYSSLSYLKRYPVHAIKIDRSFIVDLERDPRCVDIIRALVGLGHDLGLNVVCEGIETRTQYDKLLELGCDALQGYLIGKPMPLDDALARMCAPAVCEVC